MPLDIILTVIKLGSILGELVEQSLLHQFEVFARGCGRVSVSVQASGVVGADVRFTDVLGWVDHNKIK